MSLDTLAWKDAWDRRLGVIRGQLCLEKRSWIGRLGRHRTSVSRSLTAVRRAKRLFARVEGGEAILRDEANISGSEGLMKYQGSQENDA